MNDPETSQNREPSHEWREHRGRSRGRSRGRGIGRGRGRSLQSHQQQSFNQHRSRSSLPQRSQDRKRNRRDDHTSMRNHNSFSSPPRKIFKNSTESKNIQGHRIGEDFHNGSQMHRQSNNKHERYLGFKLLEEISHSDGDDILVKINQRKEAFLNLIKSHIEKPDVFVLITELMSKIALSSFNELKMQILQEICNSAYLGNFQKYLMDLPYKQVDEKSLNNLYWNNQEDFWAKFTTFNECVVRFLPLTALQKCRSIIEDSSKLCLEKLAERHDFKLSDECSLRLTQLREKLTSCEKEMRDQCKKKMQTRLIEGDGEPPQGFRELNVIPDPEELLGKQPFLRPNVVEGGYNDKEHYLDVQYRLLREDCFGPLREGIRQYMAQPGKGKFDHIRVYNNVRFIGPYIPKSQSNIGSMVQVDVTSKKWPKRINWAHSKRFLFGSLLLFTRDKCNTFIVATVLERNVQMLSRGQFVVYLVNAANEDIYDDKPYVMIESEVYFEPYFQVLNALKAPDFPEHIAMEKYIINVNPQSTPPAYLSAEKKFNITTETSQLKVTFNVLEDESWPNKEDLGFDTSQYEAYKLALTNEFAVIQGPPGTGKSFLGVKVAHTLLKNVRGEFHGCLMLVICYTNHALDQFLEGLLPMTKSIVRIGGRSRSEAMDKINLNNLRRNYMEGQSQKFMMRQKKRELREAVLELQNALDCLDIITNGVLSYKSVENFVPEEVGFLGKFYNEMGIDDPLKYWLFEHCMIYMDSQPIQWDRHQNDNIQILNNVEEDTKRTNEPILDDFEDEEHASFHRQRVSALFMINAAEDKIYNFMKTYNETRSFEQRRTLEHQIRVLNCEIKLMKDMSVHRKKDISLHITRWTNFNVMRTVDRWRLYFRWARIIANKIKLEIPKLQETMKKAVNAYEESRMIVDLELLKETRVVGMTTSGAARLRKLLQSLGPRIVIVEEAAEVLEAHIVTSLTRHCQHLILIGDHQQLRPSISNLKLVRRYNTNVSLFERMITNGIHSRRLGVQHRMRPEIAALISPHIYPDLHNHPSVQDFPNVLGMTSNLFFFTHDYQEQEVDDSSSRTNRQEGDITIALANYLIQQGYHPDDVTILTTYKGQMFYLKKQIENYMLLSHVKITVVDNYQGEESKIILLSLVRNNPDNNVGFLKIENRICVALSRAKEGLYIFGNIETLKSNSDLWKSIGETLENNGNLGRTLTLKCENHPEKITSISVAEDFMKLPEGGCGVDCSFMRPCGHKCTRLCHVYDREHIKIKCLESCEKLCDLGHGCPLKCGDACNPCQQLVEKELPCGHNKQVKCYVDPTDTNIMCFVKLDVVLPACGHKAVKDCYELLEAVLCTSKCMYRVDPCGHRCGRKCHVNDDPDHEQYVCRKPCAKAKNQCQAGLIGDRGDHQCKKLCYDSCDPCDVKVEKTRSSCGHVQRVECHQDIDQIPCQSNCEEILDCKHKCPKKCGEECGNCIKKVTKVIPECNHKIKIACSKEATPELCKEKCQRVMSCGHACTGRCNRTCAPENCILIVKEKHTAPCGHQVNLPCNIYNSIIKGDAVKSELLLKYCKEACLQELACGHLCGGSCGDCYQGRIHVPCAQICNQINICGHQCAEPCNQICPPCNKPCEIKCSCGLRCNKRCGAPCASCPEACTRKCRHGACSRRCGEPCSRPPCDEPCALRLPCGHRCRGLCGEPCPDICQICRPEDFPKDYLGGEYGENEKFITLYDCSHTFELDDIDGWVKKEPEQVKIPDCPKCRKPIINTYRYKDIINEMFKQEINPIKERVYGNAKKIAQQKKRLSWQINRHYPVNHQIVMKENLAWNKAFCELQLVIRSQKKVSLLQLDMQHQYLNILSMISKYYQSYKDAKLTHLKSEFLDIINLLCSTLCKSVQKVSQQQQKDIGNEIKRLNSIIQFATILRSVDIVLKGCPDAVEAERVAREAVLTWKRYDEEETLSVLHKLQDVVKVTGIAMKQERELVVKAIGLKAGHWYKCQNGHFYCIGECGGATQTSRCIECKAVVGGQSHRLEPSNSHAPEMDGSRFAAYSEEYNNMANFNLIN